MLPKTLLLILAFFLISCGENTTDEQTETTQDNVVEVYISKGDTQCNQDGLSLDEASSYLLDADISIAESNCGVITGVAFMSMCGAGTSNIYYFSIQESNLVKAKSLGFSALSSLKSDLGYKAKSCVARKTNH